MLGIAYCLEWGNVEGEETPREEVGKYEIWLFVVFLLLTAFTLAFFEGEYKAKRGYLGNQLDIPGRLLGESPEV